MTFQDTASFYHGITRLGASPNLYCGIRQLVNLGFAPSLDVTLCVHSQKHFFVANPKQSELQASEVQCIFDEVHRKGEVFLNCTDIVILIL